MFKHRLRLLVTGLALGAVMVASAASAIAQEATPETGPFAAMELAPGVTAEVLGASPSAGAPGQTVYLARFVFQPEASIFPHNHPGTTVLVVLSGSFGWTLEAGTAHVLRGASSGATGPIEDLTVPGTEVILQPGDEIYYEQDVVHTARGAGDTEAVVLGTLVLTTGAPLLMPAGMDMSTPTS